MAKTKSCTSNPGVPRSGCGVTRRPVTTAEVALIVVALVCVGVLLWWGYAPAGAVVVVGGVIAIVLAAVRVPEGALRGALARVIGVAAPVPGTTA